MSDNLSIPKFIQEGRQEEFHFEAIDSVANTSSWPAGCNVFEKSRTIVTYCRGKSPSILRVRTRILSMAVVKMTPHHVSSGLDTSDRSPWRAQLMEVRKQALWEVMTMKQVCRTRDAILLFRRRRLYHQRQFNVTMTRRFPSLSKKSWSLFHLPMFQGRRLHLFPKHPAG
jgi:hypothetical protein